MSLPNVSFSPGMRFIAVALAGMALASCRLLPGGPQSGNEGRAALLAQMPEDVERVLRKDDAAVERLTRQAETALRRYLGHEASGRYAKAHGLLCAGARKAFLSDPTNQAIVSDIRMYMAPPAEPTPFERETLWRMAGLVEAGKLSLEIDDPSLWAYQYTHSVGSCWASFEATGPYANEFRLVDFRVVRVTMAREDLAVGWVEELIEMPVETRVSRMGQYMLKPEEGQWRVWGYRALDGPRLESWVGLRTWRWPDDGSQM
jgi:hypothetical protein